MARVARRPGDEDRRRDGVGGLNQMSLSGLARTVSARVLFVKYSRNNILMRRMGVSS